MINEQTIISIDEFRSIAGIASSKYSDAEILEMIRQLDIMAQIYIKGVKKELQSKDSKKVPNSTIGY